MPNATTDPLLPSRLVRESAQMGVLPQAAEMLRINVVESTSDLEVLRSTSEYLKSEMEMIRHLISIAASRGQIYRREGAPDSVNAGQHRYDARMSTSQLGQDLWVLERTEHKREGFFVEFGAADGVLLSNTYLLEKQYDWKGILAEPNPLLYTRLLSNRECAAKPSCIGGTRGIEVDFVLSDEFSTMRDYADLDGHGERRQHALDQGQIVRLHTTSLHDFLIENRAPRQIDYMSIDTEGSELEILEAFPFEKWDIRLITVEHNYGETRGRIRELLESKGYAVKDAQWEDWYERHESGVSPQEPV